jgi:hypothetical protein
VIAGSPGAYGAPDPISYGTYWLSEGTSLTISVPDFVATNGTEVICTGWTGTGSAAGSGPDTSTSFTLSANSTLTWNWTPFVVTATAVSQAGGNQITLQWPSLAGKAYDVMFAPDLSAGFAPIATDLPATPPNNTYQIPIGPEPAAFYKIKMK